MQQKPTPPCIHGKNLCLQCRFFYDRKCNKAPADYCKITRST